MPNYRRAFVPGGCWFFTVTLLDRNSSLLVERIDLLRDATRKTKRRFPFRIDAMVILPDHIHAVWSLPPGDSDFSTRWRRIKAQFSKSLPKTEWRDPIRRARGERGIWQRRFWEHLIRDESDFVRHVSYCYRNPVKHGLVANIEDWPYSTYHRDLRAGIQDVMWPLADDEGYGERGGV